MSVQAHYDLCGKLLGNGGFDRTPTWYVETAEGTMLQVTVSQYDDTSDSDHKGHTCFDCARKALEAIAANGFKRSTLEISVRKESDDKQSS